MWWIKFLMCFASILLVLSGIPVKKDIKPPCKFISKFLRQIVKSEIYETSNFIVAPGNLIFSLLPVVDLTGKFRDREEFLKSLKTGALNSKDIDLYLDAPGMQYSNTWYHRGNSESSQKIEEQLSRTNSLDEFQPLCSFEKLQAASIDENDLTPSKNKTEAIKEYLKDVDFILMGTATFEAPWMYSFNVTEPTDSDGSLEEDDDERDQELMPGIFHIFKGSMHVMGQPADWIELPFDGVGEGFSMYIFKMYGELFESLEITIANMNFNELKGRKEIVDVLLPKMKITKSMDVRPFLQKMELGKIFEKSKTAFYVDKFLQITTLHISEFGAGHVQQSSTPRKMDFSLKSSPVTYFHVLDSFVYVIVHKYSGLPILFGHWK